MRGPVQAPDEIAVSSLLSGYSGFAYNKMQADVAQLAERLIRNQQVTGSIPVVGSSNLFMEETEVFTLLGEAGFARLTAAFYRQIPQDDILGPMYPAADLKGAEQRLRNFLIFRFGGPARYIEQRGHPRLRQRHFRFPITQAARDRWILLMMRAIETSELPDEAAQCLSRFFAETATFLINQSESVSAPGAAPPQTLRWH